MFCYIGNRPLECATKIKCSYFSTKNMLWVFKGNHLVEINWALSRENLSLGFANNKDADQPVHLRSLISAFVVRLLQSIISRLAKSKISNF